MHAPTITTTATAIAFIGLSRYTKHNDLCLSCVRIEKRPTIKRNHRYETADVDISCPYADSHITVCLVCDDVEKWTESGDATNRRAYNFEVFGHRIQNTVVPFTQEVGKSISRAPPTPLRNEWMEKSTPAGCVVCVCVCVIFDSLIE